MILLEEIEDDVEINEVKNLIIRHVKYTGSKHAQRILNRWEEMLPRFVKVIPKDYKRMIEAIEREKAAGRSEKEAELVAFASNVSD